MMEKKIISVKALTTIQLMTVWDSNPKLREACKNDYIDTVMDDVRRLTKFISPALFDYSIGFDNINFIRIKDNMDFFECILKMQKESRFMELHTTDKEKLVIKKARKHFDDLSDKECDRAETRFDDSIIDLKRVVLEAFNRYTTINQSKLMSHFMNVYVQEKMSRNDYIASLENPVVCRSQVIDPNFI